MNIQTGLGFSGIPRAVKPPAVTGAMPAGGYAPVGGTAVPSGGTPAVGDTANAAMPSGGLAVPSGTLEGSAAGELARQRAYANVMNNRFAEQCQTCASRRYKDGSTDQGVSFQTPTHIEPELSASAVRGHEQEHVTRNRAKAEREGDEVVSQAVVLHGAVCPECKQYYIAGGTTYTTTRSGADGHSGHQNAGTNESKGLDVEA